VKKVEKKVANKKAEPKKAAKKAATREILVVGSKVKEVIKGGEMRADGQLIEAVSAKVHELLTAGIARAKANKRKTVTPQDL
jgi:histone H3/H4